MRDKYQNRAYHAMRDKYRRSVKGAMRVTKSSQKSVTNKFLTNKELRSFIRGNILFLFDFFLKNT